MRPKRRLYVASGLLLSSDECSDVLSVRSDEPDAKSESVDEADDETLLDVDARVPVRRCRRSESYSASSADCAVVAGALPLTDRGAIEPSNDRNAPADVGRGSRSRALSAVSAAVHD